MKNIVLILMLMICGISFGIYGDAAQPWQKTNGALVPSDPLSITKRVSGIYTSYSAIDGYSPAFDSPFFMNYTRSFAATDIPVGIIGKVNNSGSTLANGGHMVGSLGWVTDTTSGRIGMIGIEGKITATGSSGNHNAVCGEATFTGSTFTGRTLAGSTTITHIYQVDGTTPLAEGTAIGYYAQAVVGGNPLTRFSFFGSDPACITATGDITKNIQLKHDGTDSHITSSSGNLWLNVPAGKAVLGFQGNNTAMVNDTMNSAQIQALIDAYEAVPGWTAANPLIIKFTPGSYTALNLTLGSNYVILDADDPGVVLAGAIASSGSPAGVYVYVWDHPSGTYPASLTLTGVTEL